MHKVMRFLAFLCAFFVFSSLTACSSTNTAKETDKEKASVTVKANDKSDVKANETQDQNQKQKSNQQNAAVNANSTNTADNKAKTAQPAAANGTTAQSKQTNQSSVSADKANSQAASSKSTPAAALKNQAATNNKTASSSTGTQQKTKTSTQPQKPVTTVTLSIVGPKDKGTIMGASKVSFTEGQSILDILLSGTKKHGIIVDYSGSGATAYVSGIDNVYEFDYGSKSGWICKQNGVKIPRSAGSIKVKQGDRIEWIYTEDYTENK